ncbi:MAG: hypothetical protein RKE49_10150 [Oceanicaulis sp.]
MTRFLLAAACGAAFVLPGLAPAEAQTYGAQSRHQGAQTYEQCVAAQRNRQVAGAVIGGVLGAVLGAELHDDAQDRAREDRRYRRDHRYRGHRGYRGREYRRGHRGYRHRGYREEGNDGAVVAGAGVGALAGAALGGAGRDDCARHARRTGRGYGAAPRHYGSEAGYRGDEYGYDRRYDDRGYTYDERGYGDGYGYDDGYGRSSGELLGGPDARGYDARRDAQVYTAGSAQGAATARNTGACRDMQSAGRLVYMCQGADGIWRPAETYR